MNFCTKEEQIGLRFYNLEQYYTRNDLVSWTLDIIKKDNGIMFDSEYSSFNKDHDTHMLYVQIVQIIREFGKELTIRFLTFNFENEITELTKAKGA